MAARASGADITRKNFGAAARGRIVFRGSLALLGFLATAVAGAAGPQVMVVTETGGGPFEQALAGLKQSLATFAPGASFHALGNESTQAELHRAPSDTVFVAMGPTAVNEVLLQQARPALVSCLSPQESRLARLEQSVNVSAEVAPEQRAAWLRRLLPKARRIALLYDPDNRETHVAGIAEALTRAGFEVLSDEVHRPSDLPLALEKIAVRADAILGIEDRSVFMPQTAKALLLFSFRNRIPLVGTHSAWTKAGALYAVEPDYTDLGRRCAQAAARLLGQGRSGMTGTPHLLLSLNLRTARHMNIEWGSDIVQLASTVYD